MYFLKKTLEISAAHQLSLPYESKCNSLHGHNWIITVFCKSEELNENAMVVDFSHIKEVVMMLDHKNLNEILDFPTTAEKLASFFVANIDRCYRADVQESSGNTATYEIC